MRELCAVKFRKHARLRRACGPRALNIGYTIGIFEYILREQVNYREETSCSIVIHKLDYIQVNEEYSCAI